MKTKSMFFIVMIFVLAFTAACGGGTEPAAPPAEAPAEVPVEEAVAEAPAEATTDFPMPEDASNVMVVGEGVTNFQTELSIPDVLTFYRLAFPNYTEREILTVVTDASLNLVFEGHESGNLIVIQGFPMGEGVVNVSIRLEAQ